MTKAQFEAVVNANGGPDNVISLIFDNDMVMDFTGKRRFSMDMLKSYSGLDAVEYKDAPLRSKKTGKYEIPCNIVNFLEFLQCIEFSPADKREDVDILNLHCLTR